MLRESVLNGLFVGLLIYSGVTCNTAALALGMASGLVAGIFLAAIRQRPWQIRLLFLLLEQRAVIQTCLLLGLCIAAFYFRSNAAHPWLLTGCVVGGLLLGVGIHGIAAIKRRFLRNSLASTVATLAVALCISVLYAQPELLLGAQRVTLGRGLLIGLPFFCILVYSATGSPSEGEAATLVAIFCMGLWLIDSSWLVTLVAPGAIYYLLADRWLPRVPSWKAMIRGAAFASSGQSRRALFELGQAARLEPDNQYVRNTLWKLHSDLDSALLATDPDLASLIDPNLCLDRVASLLNEPATRVQLTEADQLLNLVEKRDASLRPVVAYWRAVAAVHGRDIAAAGQHLGALLNPSVWKAGDAQRNSILFSAWHLSLLVHAGLEAKVGAPQLALPGRLVEAIDAVERRLVDAPQDQAAWGMKRTLYPQLTEAHFSSGPVGRIDPDYVAQLGLVMIGSPATCRRGAEFLMIAAREKPADAPRLCLAAAEALDADGHAAAARATRQHGFDVVRRVGAHVLVEPNRRAYFAIVKLMADDAAARSDLDAAIDLYQLYAECELSGIETLRTLADLLERRKDPWSALHAAAKALAYDATDADLLARRDRYLYSIDPAHLTTAAKPLRRSIDVSYCLATAQRILDRRNADIENLAWARHLAELASTLRPVPIQPRLLLARAELRLEACDKALPLLEDIRQQRPGKLASDAEADAWYAANRLLGDLYLYDFNRPDLAIGCFTDFRDSSRSGADTLYKLGLAYERTGENAKAAALYQQVLGYDDHPLATEVRAALNRLKEPRTQ